VQSPGAEIHALFVGLTQEQAAKELGISVATVEDPRVFARAGPFRDIRKSRSAPS
jgi:hypothetical protein